MARPCLHPHAQRAGYELVYRASLTSTMDEAKAQLHDGRRGAFWVVADEQTGGRGRHGRSWGSPVGNLYTTLVLEQPCYPAQAPELGFVAGLAVHKALRVEAELDVPELTLKWPNDVLLSGQKLAGILLEGLTLKGRFFVMIGIGINITSCPNELPYPAISLHAANHYLTRDELFSRLNATWMTSTERQSTGFKSTRKAWLSVAHGIGTSVRVRPPTGEIRGIMRGIDERGCLLLDTPSGEVKIDAGDLFFGD
jgi:BirA family transcriptional regulator, biotin operon repressor / biotin---[acetyl-CoA-carboxylase] ligase